MLLSTEVRWTAVKDDSLAPGSAILKAKIAGHELDTLVEFKGFDQISVFDWTVRPVLREAIQNYRLIEDVLLLVSPADYPAATYP